ncbi:bifunctional DNA-formamidopyrimidine glycosylase/DNA-(apurinic or apyrimidinic site) lyase [Chryseomicrobium palamuruense]|uniref:Bifunctional DNA-formamidopyrimidine glycosylase/DNA-(Apurinic or apyrimidinic site) lyase n=1 Tax=Chryseomicrobium palamuruense TaxID=682973 RepID=A0ABV8UX96_9BACL
MPELPEVEGVVESLRPFVIDQTIEEVEVSKQLLVSHEAGKAAIIKGCSPEELIRELPGYRITALTRKSKYMYFALQRKNEEALLVGHLGMTGAWFPVETEEAIQEDKFRKHIHVKLRLSGGYWLIYSDIRRFGELRLLQQEADYPPLLQMAPEPFTEEGRQHYLSMSEIAKYRNKPVKGFIMDGHVLSGCGNIYATEALFRMKIHPNRKVARISKSRLNALYDTIVDVLNEGIARGGSSISDYRNVNGGAGSMQHFLQMYGKKMCSTCLTETKQLIIAGRTSTYCPKCQR